MRFSSVALQELQDYAAFVCGDEFVTCENSALAIAPADAEQASCILKFCDKHRLPVSMEGSGTKQDWLDRGSTAVRLLSHRLSAVLEHPWQDMTCTVQAGCTWEAMQSTLQQHGQFVALDPLWPARASVGGVVGANESGALRLRYGGLRDLVLGMTVVLADGTIARSGGKVVKNVAGYDLPKLLCGSFGTLGFITEVTFRLHSVPRHTSDLTITADAAQPLGELLSKVLDSHLSTQSMQLRTCKDQFALDLRIGAAPEVFTAQLAALVALAANLGAKAEPADAKVWSAREVLFDAAAQHVVFKATVLVTSIANLVREIANFGGSVVAQATGIVTGRLPINSAVKIVKLRETVEAAGGSLVLLRTTDQVTVDRWGRLPESLPLMRSVKQHFDPHQILNPQRFLGNI